MKSHTWFLKHQKTTSVLGSVLVTLVLFTPFASALTYQQEIGVNFTFNPALNLTVSADLYINNLAPGAASDSNVIDVVVATNAINGYTLTANVGNNTTYNTRNLVHSNSNLSNTFTSIAYSATPTITTNTNLSADTWGFSYSTNNGSTWSNYNGLPLYSDTTNVATLKETTGPVSSASGDDVKFKIAAKASASQVSGAYNNVINFNLAANVVPQYTVQFDAGDGSGTMPSQTIFRDEATMLAPNSFTPPSGFVFTGWNTAADGSGTSYTNQESVTNIAADGGSITLYAQWAAKLYDIVASMSKGKQTAAELKAVITEPTSSNPATDTSNSGVFEYDASIFGTSSDASNDYPIYYYRGILDSDLDGTQSTNGSNGNGAYYPNYVKLGNTCWRIVRTTGSGGVKMIYNGLYSGGTNADSCANVGNNAAITSIGYNDTQTGKQIVRVGYTYNNNYAVNTAYNVPISTALGSDSNYTANNTDSLIKDYIENTWFASGDGISAYERILEPSAGYCNDRTVFSNASPYIQQAESTNIVTYGNSGLTEYLFGSGVRNQVANSTRTLTLSCPRSTVDLYTTSSATNGNKQLAKPVALLTADEMALSGSGNSGAVGGSASAYSSSYNFNPFLKSGSYVWSLSPYGRENSGSAISFLLYGYGGLSTTNTFYPGTVRPVVSLKPGTTAVSGSGTATDPWVVKAPTTIEKAYERAGATKLNGYYQMQDMTPEICNSVEAINHQTQVIDSRDNKVYWVAKLADGNCWMTQNLDHDIVTTQNFYTYANTDIGHGSTPNTSATWTASTATYSSNSTWNNPVTTPESYNPGDYCWNGTLEDSNVVSCNQNGSHFHLGNFYNWTAAVAMNNSSSYTTLTDVDQSICPSGWALPKDGSTTTSGSIRYLITQYNWDSENWRMTEDSYSMWDSPIYSSLSGYWGSSGSLGDVGLYGGYWSSVVNNSSAAYGLSYDYDGSANPVDNYIRGSGVSVRCVAR